MLQVNIPSVPDDLTVKRDLAIATTVMQKRVSLQEAADQIANAIDVEAMVHDKIEQKLDKRIQGDQT